MKSLIKPLINTPLGLFGLQLVAKQPKKYKYPIDYSAAIPALIDRVRPYTMCGDDGVMTAIEAMKYVLKNGIPGDIVECGVWRGGCCMAMALAVNELGGEPREFWLYDTFEGMTEPTSDDVDKYNQPARLRLKQEQPSSGSYTKALNVWCMASLEDVTANVKSINYPYDKFRFIKGDVLTTLPQITPDKIAVLRLDTDWYASTRLELELLYPKLVSGGVLIIDDYGDWQGARKAADEYFSTVKNAPLLIRVDGSRVAVKP
jgi:O-methyltransferase